MQMVSASDAAWPFQVARQVAEEERLPLPEVTAQARTQAALTAGLPGAAVRVEIEALLMGRGVHLGLQWLHDSGLLAIWLPELEATVDFSQEAGRRHKDVWEHTKQVVRQTVPRPLLRWAALLHDIGKVPTRTFLPDGGVHFHRHSEVGARMFREVAQRLGFEGGDKRKIKFLIYNHLRAGQFDGTWTDAAVRRFDKEMGADLTDLLDLSRADITSARPGKRQAALQSISDLSQRIADVRAADAILPPLPTGIGNLIMEHFGLEPSRQIGLLKRALEQAVEAGELPERQPAEFYLPFVAKLLGRE